MRSTVPLSLSALLLLAACNATQQSALNPFSPPAHGTGWERGAQGPGTLDTDEVLLGWDGAPVGGGPARRQTPGSVAVAEGGLGHGLEGSEGGSRLVLLELYQQSIEERDALALEVDAQNTALEQAEKRYRALERSFADLQHAFDTLSAEKTAVVEERRELAARLTTAQIRRLQAEKAWLEATIEWRDLSHLGAQARELLGQDATGGDR